MIIICNQKSEYYFLIHIHGIAICAVQIVMLLVCIEQYISTGSKPVPGRVACSVHATNFYAKDLSLDAQ